MSRARQASLSLRSRPRLRRAEPRNRSFSSALLSDGQNQHIASSEHRAWAGDWSRIKSSTKLVRQRHGRRSSLFTVGVTAGIVTAMAGLGTPCVVIPVRSRSWWIQVPVVVSCPFLLGFLQPCLPNLFTVGRTDKSRLALTALTAGSPDY